MNESTSDQMISAIPKQTVAPNSRTFDLIIVTLLAIFSCSFTWTCSHRISWGLRNPNTDNVWFESDVSRVYLNMSSRLSNQYRTRVHPVFPLVALSAGTAIARVARFDLDDAANGFLAGTAALWAILMYSVLRMFSFDRALSALGTLSGILSASGFLFMTVPETYSLASVSMLACIAIIFKAENKPWQYAGWILGSACSLAITVTNWALGLALSFRRYTFRQWVQISANAFVVVAALWTVEKARMPSADFFTAFSGEQKFAVVPSIARLWKVGNAFLFHSMIAPSLEQTGDFGIHEHVGPDWPLGLSFQNALPGSGSLFGAVAAGLWLLALALGVHRMLRPFAGGFSKALLVFLTFQFALHLVYGAETFMYALDWLPVLIICASFGFEQLRKVKWPVALLFVSLLAVNNFRQFDKICQVLNSYAAAHPLSHATTKAEMIGQP